MTIFEKTVQIITAIIASLTFVWGVVSAVMVWKQNKKLTKMQGVIDRGSHVSKVVFDKIFSTFERITVVSPTVNA